MGENKDLTCDVLIVGCGVGGLYASLNLPANTDVVMLSKGAVDECDSMLAQGGICVLPEAGDYDAFFEDTMRAGHYENRRESVDIMIRSSRSVVNDLLALGTRLERDADGGLAFTREGAHSRPRICYHADVTGKEITEHLLAAVRRLPNVRILEHTAMTDLVVEGGACRGVVAMRVPEEESTETASELARAAGTGVVGGAGPVAGGAADGGAAAGDVADGAAAGGARATVGGPRAAAGDAAAGGARAAAGGFPADAAGGVAAGGARAADGDAAADGSPADGAAVDADFVPFEIRAAHTILATGGIGGVYDHSTNFPQLTGDACILAAKHGIEQENLDYVQIHPTGLYTEKPGRTFLISESCRGEGAVLLNQAGERFTDELQPRDVVAAAIREQMWKDGSAFEWLSFAPVPRDVVLEHFGTIREHCIEELGRDILEVPIPVVPTQHYFMGGVRVDKDGRTSMPGLFAVGETACNGVHGRNRLASNSLLESLVWARRAAVLIATGTSLPVEAAGEPVLDGQHRPPLGTFLSGDQWYQN